MAKGESVQKTVLGSVDAARACKPPSLPSKNLQFSEIGETRQIPQIENYKRQYKGDGLSALR